MGSSLLGRARIDAEVARLSRLHCQHQETQYTLRSRVRHLTEDLPRLEPRLAAVREDLATRQDTSESALALTKRQAPSQLDTEPSETTPEAALARCSLGARD